MKSDLLKGKPSAENLRIRQSYSLAGKISVAEQRIREWYEHWDGLVYVSFSGGKDSTVLLHIARGLYPDIEAVFVDTGLEFPEIRDFVKTFDNVTWVKPKMPFTKVIEKYGYPIISKEQACYIDQYRNTKSEKLRSVRWNGKPEYRCKSTGKISEKWKYLVNAPFGISERCCYVMKKSPTKSFETKTKKKPIVGTMVTDSNIRKINYMRFGCNAFDLKRPMSTPLSIWNEDDIWNYIRHFKVKYSEIYDIGYERTGCMFCLFGYHMERKHGHDRLKQMAQTHPKQYKYCMEKLGLDEVLEWYPERLEPDIFE